MADLHPGDPLFTSLIVVQRDRDNVAAVMRACDAIASLDPRYEFSREKVLDTRSGWTNQIVERRPRPRHVPRGATARKAAIRSSQEA